MQSKTPSYTLAEAAQLLNITESDVHYQIEKGDITPILFTVQRSFIVFSEDERGRKIGHCHFIYQGPLQVQEKLIQVIIKGNEGPFYGTFQILDGSRVSAYNNQYPFKNKIPNKEFVSWEPKELTGIDSKLCYAAVMPKETQQLFGLLSETLSRMSAGNHMDLKESQNKKAEAPYEYNWHENGNWGIQDFRIPLLEIERKQKACTAPALVDSLRRLPKTDKKNNQLHGLIEIVFLDNPGASTHKLWSLIRKDGELDSPLYDIDGIIKATDADCIEWESSYGNYQSMKRRTFDNHISKIRILFNS